MTRLRVKLAGLLAIGLFAIGIFGLVGGISEIEWLWKDDVDDPPPTTTITTVITTATDTPPVTVTQTVTPPPTTTPPPPATTPPTPPPATTPKPLDVSGKIGAEGTYGLYDPGFQPVKTYPFWFGTESKEIAWFITRANYIEIVGGYDLDTKFVAYLKIRVEDLDNPGVEIQLDKLHRNSEEFEVHKFTPLFSRTIDTRYYGAINLESKWVAVETDPMEFRISLSGVFSKLGISLSADYVKKTLRFHNEMFFECWGLDGQLYGAVKSSKMLAEITYIQQYMGGGMFNMSGTPAVFGVDPLIFVIIGGVGAIWYYQRKKKNN